MVYKLLKTPENCYVYDRNSNKILNISEKDYIELEQLQKKEITQEQVKCLPGYRKYGYLKESVLEEIVHPETTYVKHYLEHRVTMLILQVTQNCNLRCAYCAYSGRYENRVHSNKNMTWETAKEAIDHLITHSNELEEVMVSFYGGEPLLRIDLIRQCVEYIKQNYPDRNVFYGMTTNGTLLNLEIGEFLIENRFNVTISLDGSKKEHDENRVFANGKGSFDTIIKNIKELIQYDQRFMERLRFNTVLSPDSDYKAVEDFFSTEEIVCKADVGLTLMEELNCKEDIVFGEKFIDQRRYEQFKVMLIMLKKLKNHNIKKVMIPSKNRIDEDYKMLEKSAPLVKKCHHSGPCIPGASRMFVTADRKIYVCEKAPELCDALCIGNLDSGIDEEKVCKTMNIGTLTKDECTKCWAFSWCSMCSMYAAKDGKLDRDAILSHCEDARRSAEERLTNICVLKEFDYKFGKDELYV